MSRILVVEDDRDVREALVEVLEEEDLSVSAARHGREALDYLTTVDELPRVILLDLMMPVMDGRRFREEQLKDDRISGIPVILMSAAGEHSHAPIDVAASARKPVDLATLLALVRRYA